MCLILLRVFFPPQRAEVLPIAAWKTTEKPFKDLAPAHNPQKLAIMALLQIMT